MGDERLVPGSGRRGGSTVHNRAWVVVAVMLCVAVPGIAANQQSGGQQQDPRQELEALLRAELAGRKLANQGRSQLWDLQLDAAERTFRGVLTERREPFGLGPDYSKELAAFGLAEVRAERGDFAGAARQLDEWWEGLFVPCGNGAEALYVDVHLLTTVWRAAALPGEQARDRPQAIGAGQFEPTRTVLNGDSSAAQKEMAATAAKLYLAETLERAGSSTSARALFNEVANLWPGKRVAGLAEDFRALAAAHLKGMKDRAAGG